MSGRRLLVLLASLGLAAAGSELALRAAGFRWEMGIEFAYPRHFRQLVPDARLFWRLPPQSGVNALGFLGPPVRFAKRPGERRLLVLGDSVPMQGYPGLAVEALGREGVPLDLVNLSMAGYSSHQGLVLCDLYVPRLKPDVTLVSYGWNDHWRAYGDVDARKVVASSRAADAFWAVARHTRLLQLLGAGVSRLAGRDRPLPATRVPLPDFERNLLQIADRLGRVGSRVVLATAPSAHGVAGVPRYLVEGGFAGSAAEVTDLHARYAEVVRSVASRTGSVLLDLEREWGSRHDLATLFLSDGIHLTERGNVEAARRLATSLLSLGGAAEAAGAVNGSGGR